MKRELLREAARPRKIVLFGSHARGEADPESDLDILVVEKEVPDRAAEIVRLNRVLIPLRIPVDLLVVSEDVFECMLRDRWELSRDPTATSLLLLTFQQPARLFRCRLRR